MKGVLVNAALVGVGGFLGALLRFGLGNLVHRSAPGTSFPMGTLSVNMIGCLLIGLVVGVLESRHLLFPEFRSFAVVGLLGGFTTFSAFGYETFVMMRDAEPLRAIVNVMVHVVLGLLLVWLGYWISSAAMQ